MKFFFTGSSSRFSVAYTQLLVTLSVGPSVRPSVPWSIGWSVRWAVGLSVCASVTLSLPNCYLNRITAHQYATDAVVYMALFLFHLPDSRAQNNILALHSIAPKIGPKGVIAFRFPSENLFLIFKLPSLCAHSLWLFQFLKSLRTSGMHCDPRECTVVIGNAL